MKVALCFIISYEHILNKEEIWKEWIEPNKDIINVYFYYKDFTKIKSQWIKDHTIPPCYLFETSYYHVIPAYLSIMQFALTADVDNSWFCMLTDSCCPIISPNKFRDLFYTHYNKSLMSWKPAWWNVDFHKRANLKQFSPDLRLANDPWFILKRENVLQILNFASKQSRVTKIICDGGLANESLFAIILHGYKQLGPNGGVLSQVTHLADWNRMASATSPHLFKDANDADILFLDTELKKNKCAAFVRKISPEFPDDVLRHYIYKVGESNQTIRKPIIFIYSEIIAFLRRRVPLMLFAFAVYVMYARLYNVDKMLTIK